MTKKNTPFFIVGVHRSGTTLLRYMLSSHSRLYAPPESDFIPRFFLGRPHDALSEADVAGLLDVIFTEYRFVRDWQGERPSPTAFFRDMTTSTPAAFLDLLYTRYAAQNGAARWGDKTPIYASYIPLLHALFPQAQFIHIIRDGRDVALSMLDKWGEKEMHVDLYFAARNWTRRIRQAQAAGRRLGPDQFHRLYYEDLVRDPEAELRAICAFLGEQLEEQMLAHHRLAQRKEDAGGFHEAVRRPPSTQRIGRWRREMATADLRLFQRVAGPLLPELGYDLADVGEMSGREHGRYLFLAAKYHLLQAGRRVLQAAGLKPPI
jgi:hypothetical protein